MIDMEKVTPEKIVAILKSKNVNVTLEQAKNVLDILYLFCNLSMKQTLRK
jgi:hypothetical protein